MASDLTHLSIRTAHERLCTKDFSVSELVHAFLDVAKEKNKDLNAYLEIYSDIDKQTETAQKKIENGEAGALTGIPLAIKDNILIKGKKASAASKILENYTAPYTATAAQKIINEDAVFLGRTNMDEFAMGGSTENSAFGVTKNPHDLTRVPGGSSGGSAAAVGGGLALAALGSDTGGSIRQPASFCGCVGLKPTYGSVSRHGLMAMGSSLDVIGPITRTVDDAEILFNAMKGQDPYDSTTYPDGTYPPRKEKKNMIIGVPKEILETKGMDEDVKKNFEDSIKKLTSLGYTIKEISLQNIMYSLASYYVLMPAEVSSNLARFDGVKYGLRKEGKDLLEEYLITRREGFGREVRRRIMLGTYVLSSGYYDAYYNKANTVRSLIARDFTNAFEKVDAVITPTAPSPAFKIGEKSGDPLSMYLADIFTVTANIVGIPAISIPSGTALRDGSNLPLGLQIMAPHAAENILFAVGKRFLGEV
ncbi:MAG: Asp-tRNA(Asn)/Glu-tRNA(Gln) amidotransferase subunit GatA [Patescibacteria group bacterium]|nr:Asp-tRNA(Asn)/Glu-tRNA(Gln) amidotransferase subunit GatA [bacterium]MDZ4240896.1 Asp-tRNA(Asn)/Glu-tRNA(Gln) amidotransferase subunit GatA [Patescibacteria group bacterium]